MRGDRGAASAEPWHCRREERGLPKHLRRASTGGRRGDSPATGQAQGARGETPHVSVSHNTSLRSISGGPWSQELAEGDVQGGAGKTKPFALPAC